MLTIRPDQLAALDAEAARRFERWLMAHVRRHFPHTHDLADRALLAALREAVARAGAFRIRDAASVVGYVNLEMALGPRFYDDARVPWARTVLDDSSLPEDAKLLALNELLDDTTLESFERTRAGA